MKETKKINSSLLELKNVLLSLEEIRSKSVRDLTFVNYRNCQLTRLLQNSLGNGYTMFIGTVSPCGDDFQESLSTLKFTSKIQNINNYNLINNKQYNKNISKQILTRMEQLLMKQNPDNNSQGMLEYLQHPHKIQYNNYKPSAKDLKKFKV